MKTKFKAALLACLTLCLAIAAFAFAGCVGNGGYDGSYKVTVQYADGSAVTGVRIQLCVLNEDGEEGLCLTPVAVNDEGYAEVAADEGSYAIHVLDIEEGYKVEGGTYNDITYVWGINSQDGVYSYTITIVEE